MADKRRVGRPNTIGIEKILDAAGCLLAEQGEAGLSMRKIAALLNVSPTSIYGHFANKDVLLNALANRLFSDFNGNLTCADSWQGGLRQWMNTWRERIQSTPGSLIIFGMMATAPRAMEELEQLVEVLMPVVANNTERAVQEAQSLWWAVFSFCYFEQLALQPNVVQRIKTAVADLENDTVSRHIDVESYNRLWQVTVERNIRGLAS